MDSEEHNKWFRKTLASKYPTVFSRIEYEDDLLTDAIIDDPRGEKYELKLSTSYGEMIADCYCFHAHFLLFGEGDRKQELEDAIAWLLYIKSDELVVYSAFDNEGNDAGGICCDPTEQLDLKATFPRACKVEVFSFSGKLDRTVHL